VISDIILSMKNPSRFPAVVAFLALAVTSHAEVTLVEHHFGGLAADPLNGVAADTFDKARITGVTGNWVAASEFKADGSFVGPSGSGPSNERSAHLDLGGYIDASKGTPGALFKLTATYDVTIRWLSVGFGNTSTPATDTGFHATGLGQMYAFTTTSGGNLTLYTSNVGLSGNAQRGAAGAYTNPLEFTVELDYRTWNGTTDFGKVTYFAGDTQVHSFAFASSTNTMARSILICANHSGAIGDYARITLTQAIEPDDASSPRLTISPATAPGTGFDLEWDSLAGKRYNLRTSTDLAGPVAEWDLLEGNIAATPPANIVNVPADDPRRFYAVEEFDAPPLLSESFEDGDGGFTVVTSEGSAWARGTPDSSGPSGTVNSGNGAAPGTGKCWGTNLGAFAGGSGDPGFYANPTTTRLRSPVIDLTDVAAAELSFYEALDLEEGDSAVVNIIAANDDTILAAAIHTSTDENPNTAAWTEVSGISLSAGIGQKIRIEWVLGGTGGTTQDYMGWYLDDVTVIETTP